MRNFTLWRCWPQEPNKVWEQVYTHWADSYEDAYLYFFQNSWMVDQGDWVYIITF